MTQAERDRLVALKKAKKKLITQKQAAEELGITERHVRRLLRELKRRGDKVVAHGLRGLPSNRKIECRYRAGGGGDSFAAGVSRVRADTGGGVPGEEARDRGEPGDGAAVDDRQQSCGGRGSSESRRCMSGGRGAAGSGSWCSGTPAITTGWKDAGKRSCLINMIDDATSRWFARFVSSDSTAENMNHCGALPEEVRAAAGLLHRQSGAVSDRGEDASGMEPEWGKSREELPPTQIGRASAGVGNPVDSGAQSSGQRAGGAGFLTAQDRLVKGMRVAGVTTMEQANQYLETEFLPWVNGTIDGGAGQSRRCPPAAGEAATIWRRS